MRVHAAVSSLASGGEDHGWLGRSCSPARPGTGNPAADVPRKAVHDELTQLLLPLAGGGPSGGGGRWRARGGRRGHRHRRQAGVLGPTGRAPRAPRPRG